MNTWAPLWSQVVDSSLWEEKPSVRVLFMTMLALKDADHIVRFDAYKLHKKSHLSPEETIEGLDILSKPDKRRKEFPQEFEGRRIKQVDAGYLILNGQKYRDMVHKFKVRAYKTDWEANKRAKKKSVVKASNSDGDVARDYEAGERRYVKVLESAGQEAADAQFDNEQRQGLI